MFETGIHRCMKVVRLKYYVLFIFLLSSLYVAGQGDIEDLLHGSVENINPVYKPIIGFGVGTFNFLGDVRDPGLTVFNGTPGYRINVATFLDNNHYIRTNFYAMLGSLTGNERSYNDISRNLNFKSDLLMFGINFNYDFDHFIKRHRTIHPFISVGFETITFDSKTDSLGAEGVRYHYWGDGSVRSHPEGDARAVLVKRDYKYETDLKNSVDWGLGDYPPYAFAVPIEVGLDFWLSDRVLFRLGTSYHFTFTDAIDHVSHKNDPDIDGAVVGNKRNDDFLYTYMSLHLDLFSSDKEIEWNKFFSVIDPDESQDLYTFYFSDEDADGIYDTKDDCIGTPFGVSVDSSGCPMDDDLDGIPNYKDDEPNSRYGAMVDERGVEMSQEDVALRIDQSDAVAREDISKYIRTPSSYAGYKKRPLKAVPRKFKDADIDEDGYISFDEMMDAIDSFFDFDSELETDDVYELNDFFFSQ